jgi:hypothetical protein
MNLNQAQAQLLARQPCPALVVDHGTDEDFRDAFILVWVINDEAQKAAAKAAFKVVADAVSGLFMQHTGLSNVLMDLLAAQPMNEAGGPAFPLDFITGRTK